MKLEGKGALVAGGASGLGEATVRALVARGARVVVADRNVERGARLVDELGDAVHFVATDVTDEASVTAALAAATSRGGLHVLVNTAGIGVAAKLIGRQGPHDLNLFRKIIEVNLIGTFNTMRLAAVAMMDNPAEPPDGERGVIINTASVAAFEGQIGQVGYSASKGGVAGMTLPVARELASSGIRVVTVAPGLFDTPMMAGLPEKARVSLAQQVPFPQRLGRPAEYADLVCHIVSNPMLNGSVIRLDGAIRMAPR